MKAPKLLICLLLLSNFTFAQLFEAKNYPKDYFIWPLEARVDIVANFGELRPNHFHMGLDFPTEQGENRPVLAAADGYVARVNVDPNGFGRAIYINHPNGLTTVYAHLNDFYPALHKYIKDEEYKNEKWKITMTFTADKFPVKKGQLIAYSGNTGGSLGPHLHYEIRDTKSEKVLNELFFGLPFKDNVSPEISKVAIFNRNKSTYEQTPAIYQLKKETNAYTIPGGVMYTSSDKISFGITAIDRLSGFNDPNGIYGAILYLDNKIVSGFEIDSISYDDTRYSNAHIDFKTKATGGPYIQHLSPLPGNKNSIYRCPDNSQGIISLNDNQKHRIKIEVYDINKNTSRVEFDIEKRGTALPEKKNDGIHFFAPNKKNVFKNDFAWVEIPENCLYDSVEFQCRSSVKNGKTVYTIMGSHIPSHDYFKVKLKANFPLTDTGKIIMKVQAGSKTRYKKAMNRDNWYEASFREFGNYELIADRQAPVISSLWGFKDGVRADNMRRIGISVTDNCSVIDSFTALLDGKWIMFTNDKEEAFIYNFDEHCTSGEHLLEIIVKDLAGNTSRKSFKFIR